MNFDVLIIGGGVIGLSIAHELKRRGVTRIAVVDRGQVGWEASWAAAGMLAPNIECEKVDEFHRFCTASLDLFPSLAESLFAQTGIDIGLDRTGTLYLAFEDGEGADAMEKYRLQRDAGIAVESLSPEDVLKLEPLVSSNIQFGLLYPNDWQVDNRRLVDALAALCRSDDISFIEDATVETVAVRGGRVIGVKTATRTIFADHVFLAAGAWTSLISIEGLEMNIPVRPIRGQMLAYQGDARRFRCILYSHRGYVVPRFDGRVLVGATVEDAGFDKELTAAGIRSLEEAAVEISPFLAHAEPTEKWAGLRPFAADGLPVISPVPEIEGLFIATGHYRNGILLSPITAQIAAEYIVDRRHSEYFSLFGPHRFSHTAPASFQTNA